MHHRTFEINPLVLNYNSKRAIDYCTKEETELHDLLAHYQQWKPEKKVMSPYCRRRLRAFLLVVAESECYVAQREYLWVPKKK
jgi:hypothetical protein